MAHIYYCATGYLGIFPRGDRAEDRREQMPLILPYLAIVFESPGCIIPY
jgi:hypothetical protein